MQVTVPAIIKQKFGSLARSRWIRYQVSDKITDPKVSGHAEIQGVLTISGIIVTSLSGPHATIELPVSRLQELANDPALSHFELASAMQ